MAILCTTALCWIAALFCHHTLATPVVGEFNQDDNEITLERLVIRVSREKEQLHKALTAKTETTEKLELLVLDLADQLDGCTDNLAKFNETTTLLRENGREAVDESAEHIREVESLEIERDVLSAQIAALKKESYQMELQFLNCSLQLKETKRKAKETFTKKKECTQLLKGYVERVNATQALVESMETEIDEAYTEVRHKIRDHINTRKELEATIDDFGEEASRCDQARGDLRACREGLQNTKGQVEAAHEKGRQSAVDAVKAQSGLMRCEKDLAAFMQNLGEQPTGYEGATSDASLQMVWGAVAAITACVGWSCYEHYRRKTIERGVNDAQNALYIERQLGARLRQEVEQKQKKNEQLCQEVGTTREAVSQAEQELQVTRKELNKAGLAREESKYQVTELTKECSTLKASIATKRNKRFRDHACQASLPLDVSAGTPPALSGKKKRKAVEHAKQEFQTAMQTLAGVDSDRLIKDVAVWAQAWSEAEWNFLGRLMEESPLRPVMPTKRLIEEGDEDLNSDPSMLVKKDGKKPDPDDIREELSKVPPFGEKRRKRGGVCDMENLSSGDELRDSAGHGTDEEDLGEEEGELIFRGESLETGPLAQEEEPEYDDTTCASVAVESTPVGGDKTPTVTIVEDSQEDHTPKGEECEGGHGDDAGPPTPPETPHSGAPVAVEDTQVESVSVTPRTSRSDRRVVVQVPSGVPSPHDPQRFFSMAVGVSFDLPSNVTWGVGRSTEGAMSVQQFVSIHQPSPYEFFMCSEHVPSTYTVAEYASRCLARARAVLGDDQVEVIVDAEDNIGTIPAHVLKCLHHRHPLMYTCSRMFHHTSGKMVTLQLIYTSVEPITTEQTQTADDMYTEIMSTVELV